jgi:hypothetical protein
MAEITDKQRIDFIEEWARKSRTGVSVDWDPVGYRFMSFHNLGDFHRSAREAIDAAILARTPQGSVAPDQGGQP